MEICSVCGCGFEYPPVPVECCLNSVPGDVNNFPIPACCSCASVQYLTAFDMVFKFALGTDVKQFGSRPKAHA